MSDPVLISVFISGAILLASWYVMPAGWATILLKTSRFGVGLRSRTHVVDGIRWHYLEGGTGPTLLLVHGFGGDADNWLAVSRKLGKYFHIIAPDLPGFGTSSRAEHVHFDVTSQAARVAAFMEAIGHTPTYIGGSSMGGWIAATLARKHFPGIKGLWLIAPLGVKSGAKSEMLSAIETGQANPVELERVEDFESRVIGPMFVKPPPMPFPLKRFYATRAVRRSLAARRQFEQVIGSTSSLEDTLAGIETPVLLQWGTGDRAVDVTGATALEKAVPAITVLIQENVGHLPMIETPGISSCAFLDFCKRS